MLKLKHLFNNADLAYKLLSNYDHDLSDSKQLTKFRISSNAVYVYPNQNNENYLRFAPVSEKKEEYLIGELNYLDFLYQNKYPVAEINLTKNNSNYIKSSTPWGDYLVASFKRVPGESINNLEINHDLMNKFGTSLGLLHKISRNAPSFSRPTYLEVLEQALEYINEYKKSNKASQEYLLLKDYFTSIDSSKDSFGIIHYDFELDNAHYDLEDQKFFIFDFDDSMYHYYIMDINQSLESIFDSCPNYNEDSIIDSFISGYKEILPFNEADLKHLPACKRFADFYSYARVLRSSYEEIEDQPEWMINLRKKLKISMLNKEKNFGNKL